VTSNNGASDATRIDQPIQSGGGDGDGGDGGDGGGGDGGGDGGDGGDGGNAGDPEDTDPPETSLRKPKLKGKKVTFKFSSDEQGTTFECRLDKRRFKRCTSPKTYRKLDEGKHKFFVAATDAAGNEGAAVKAKFKVR
jgi:hypothetical protein